MAKIGRPSAPEKRIMTPQVCEIVLNLITEGMAVSAIGKMPNMPSAASIHAKVLDDPAFAENYARACAIRTDLQFDEMLQIADTPMIGEKRKTDADGNVEVTEGDMIEHRRLQIETRKWMMGKMAPKKYGEKLDITGRIGLTVILDSDADKL